jgi:hypothetical protein
VICIAGAVPECLEITPIFETVNAVLVELTPFLSMFIGIGLGIGIAFFMLHLVANAIDRAFLQPELAKLKRDNQMLDEAIALFHEEEKPKRKNDERHWYQDENGDYVAWSEAADDGEVWYLEIDFYADEEERIERR